MSYEKYVALNRNDDTWADEIIIQATARYLKRTISCFMSTWGINGEWLDFAPLEINEELKSLCIANKTNYYFVGSQPDVGSQPKKQRKAKKVFIETAIFSAFNESYLLFVLFLRCQQQQQQQQQ